MAAGVELLEKPLPKPSENLEGYASARALEALVEARLALRFIREGFTRNAAGKAFLAWRALTAALLALCLDRLRGVVRGGGEERWLKTVGLLRVPTSKIRRLSELLEACVRDYSFYTDKAFNLHDYEYHGPDPDMAVSKYRDRLEAARDTVRLLSKLAGIVEGYVKRRLGEMGRWGAEHEEEYKKLYSELAEAEQRLGVRRA